MHDKTYEAHGIKKDIGAVMAQTTMQYVSAQIYAYKPHDLQTDPTLLRSVQI